MLPIAVMQGRLLPPRDGRFQSFPAEEWRDEFTLAREAGLEGIEWIFEEPNEARNPLGSDAGVAEMRRLAERSGVAVRSICADYYMTRRLIGTDAVPDATACGHLRWLLGRAARLGATYVVLPFVDSSRLASAEERSALVALLRTLAPEAEAAGVELHLETDFAPEIFAGVLSAVDHPFVRANFDIGNSAALGWEPAHELTVLAPWLGSVHVKDRVLGGGTVPLGTGNADLPTAFAHIRAAGFGRWLVLQVARGADGGEVAWLSGVREQVTALWRAAAGE